MKSVADSTFCVVDGGLFFELALRLAREAKRVLYCNTISSPYPKVHEAVIGDGFADIERIKCFWPYKNEIDVFVFPDCFQGPLHAELREQGKAVWASGAGCDLENKREMFRRVLKEIGLQVAPYEVVVGVTALGKYLWDKKNKFVKISEYRGNLETFRWVDRQTSAFKLVLLAHEFGSVREQVRFLVEDEIPTEIEWGYDGYFAGGGFPNRSSHGPEIKDQVYIGSMVDYAQLPPQILEVLTAIGPVLADVNYANAFSAEVRITDKGEGYFTDPTCRFPMPAGSSQLEFYGNLPEIILAGANGELVDPKPTAKFSLECLLDHKGEKTEWRELIIPNHVRQWIKLNSAVQVGHEAYAFPPLPHSSPCIGTILGQGDTIMEAHDHLQDNLAAIKDQPVSAPVHALAEAIKEIHEAEEQGVELTEQKVPEPAAMIESK